MISLSEIPLRRLKQFHAEIGAEIDHRNHTGSGSHIVELVESQFGLNKHDLHLKTQKHIIATPRQVAMMLMRESGMTYQDIANFFNKDHSHRPSSGQKTIRS